MRHAQLVTDARTDFKTGLLNAGTWQREAAAAVARAARAGQPVAVAVLDLDWFKQVNDTHGHLFGDEVLRQIGRCLPSALRDYDLAGRFGGDEFVLLLPRTRAADAHRVAERVRTRIASLPLRATNGDTVQVTASLGVAALAEGTRSELNGLLAAADAALYEAKRHGRNQVQMLRPRAQGTLSRGLRTGHRTIGPPCTRWPVTVSRPSPARPKSSPGPVYRRVPAATYCRAARPGARPAAPAVARPHSLLAGGADRDGRSAMRTTTLGHGGPQVSRAGLGLMGMSGTYGPADEKESIATIHAAVDAGITLLDTGDFYGMGHNELLLREALRSIPTGPGLHPGQVRRPA